MAPTRLTRFIIMINFVPRVTFRRRVRRMPGVRAGTTAILRRRSPGAVGLPGDLVGRVGQELQVLPVH